MFETVLACLHCPSLLLSKHPASPTMMHAACMATNPRSKNSTSYCSPCCLVQLFEVPKQYVVRIPIRHPTNDAITALGLEWYAIPAVSNIELSVGGITYTAAPFNGWYADTEIVRNLTDQGRYNMAPAVATCLGLDVRQESSLWRDRAVVEVAVAVTHSFKEAGMGK